MLDQLNKKEKQIAIVGLGYVGLPIALEFAKIFKVIGFDINSSRIEMMKNGIDPSNELVKSDFENKDILFTDNIDDLKNASFYIVAVPTPIDEHNNPNLKYLFSSSEIVGKVISKGDIVVYESTVYPGCTEEDCIPIIEKVSGLTFVKDFKAGYSPERINPGDKEHTLTKIVKVVSGCDNESLEIISDVYNSIIEAGIHKASTIKVAEAAKVIENTQRDLNIALMNELSLIFNKMNINTYEVIEAASSKWNFLKFQPGLVGGHCIGVDPYYLTHKASELGYHSRVILSGRFINDYMGSYIAKETIKLLVSNDKSLKSSKVLVMGATFKENVSDIRNSKVADVINELKSFHLHVDIIDPYASSTEFLKEYGHELSSEIRDDYDAIILAVPHKKYLDLDSAWFEKITNIPAVFCDIKGVFKNKINKNSFNYWSL